MSFVTYSNSEMSIRYAIYFYDHIFTVILITLLNTRMFIQPNDH